MPYFVYIIQCKDKTLYTGITNDLERRFAAHKNGTGAKYTRSHPPERIVYVRPCRTKIVAMKREAMIKKLSRLEKLTLMQNTN